MILGNIFLIFVLIALNAFFVGVEFAAVTSRRARLDLLAGVDSRSAKMVRRWLEQPVERDRLIAATQLGITAISLALGAVGENTFEAILDPIFVSIQLPSWLVFIEKILPALPLVISLLVVTSLEVVFGEQVPKVAVLQTPEKFALFAAPAIEVFSSIFKWLVYLLDWATHLVLHLFGVDGNSTHAGAASVEEIKAMVSGPEVEGVIEEPEREMISAVIDFGELVVRQVSLPRTEIIAVEGGTSLDDLIQMITRHAITKLPVYEEDLDHIVGIVHARDMLAAIQAEPKSEKKARDLAREALFVPETVSVNDLLHQFRARRTHIAVVLDEFGGTAGLVTLEDLLEEIVGVVNDSFETEPPHIQLQPDGSALIDGMTLIEEVNDTFHLELSEPNYDTIAGFVLGKLGRIAQVGDEVLVQDLNIKLRVKSMDRLRIAQVVLSRLSSE